MELDMNDPSEIENHYRNEKYEAELLNQSNPDTESNEDKPATHEHQFVLADFPRPKEMTLYEAATQVPEKHFSTWTCECGAVKVVELIV